MFGCFGVDARNLLIWINQGAVFLFEFAPIFDSEFEDVVVGDGVGDDIAVELFVEEVCCGSFAVHVAHGVVGKDGGAGEAEHLGTVEEGADSFVGVAELGAVTLVEDEHDRFVLEVGERFFVPVLANGGV